MIKVYPIQVEATDGDNGVVFILKTFDSHSAEIEIKTLITMENVYELLSSIRRGVEIPGIRVYLSHFGL
ncbi:hypothetical protein CCP4SC76_1790004 [Gammaproteobacteria bacterium]